MGHSGGGDGTRHGASAQKGYSRFFFQGESYSGEKRWLEQTVGHLWKKEIVEIVLLSLGLSVLDQ